MTIFLYLIRLHVSFVKCVCQHFSNKNQFISVLFPTLIVSVLRKSMQFFFFLADQIKSSNLFFLLHFQSYYSSLKGKIFPPPAQATVVVLINFHLFSKISKQIGCELIWNNFIYEVKHNHICLDRIMVAQLISLQKKYIIQQVYLSSFFYKHS